MTTNVQESTSVSSNRDQMAELFLGATTENQAEDTFSKELDEALGSTKDSTRNKGSDEGDSDEDDSDEEQTSNKEDEESDEDASWAKVLGVDDKHIVLDEDGNFAGVNVKVDDVVSTVGLKDLIAGYQTTKSYTQKTQALAEEKRQLETIKSQVAESYTKKLDNVDAMTKYLQSKIVNDFQGIDWQTLRTNDPGEYAALVQDYNLRQSEVAQVLSAIEQERLEETQKMTQSQQQTHAAYLAEQATKLIEKNPEWTDPKKLKAVFNDLQQFIEESYGFSSADFEAIQDHRIVEVLKDAMAYRKGIKIADKKVIKVNPKYQKSSGKASQSNTKLDALLKRAASAKGANKRAAETDAITELLLSGG